nr:uncharacterized mitochondrial protein AtMg00810-like [Tanacetum cinerariifolium]
MLNPEEITDATTAMNMALALMAKALKLNYSRPTNNNQRISSNPRNRMSGIRNGNLVSARAKGNATGHNGNQMRCYNCRGVGHFARNCTVRPRRRDVAYLQTQLLIAQKEEVGIQLQAEEFDLMAATVDLDEIEELNANCILMANLQQASTSGTQTDKAPIYDSDGSAEYTELLEPIPESHQVPQNDNNVIYEVTSMEQSEGIVKQHPANVEQTRALYDSLSHNLAIEVEKVNTVNHKLKETNAELTIELARFKNQEKCFEISQEKYDKLERCYQNQFVGDFKSLAKEADEYLAKHKALELEIERLLKEVIDKTFFIKIHNDDILLLQVYVDDIIFESTKKELSTEFEKLMHDKFQMSSMGELSFFLGLQVKKKSDGIFISQDKYVAEVLKKFDFVNVKTASTPMESNKPLIKDEEAKDVDVYLYRSMISSLLYLTASKYLKGQPKLALWYPKDSPFDMEAYSDSDYARASLDKKSTTGGCQFLGKRLILRQCKKQTIVANSTTKAEYVAAANCCGQVSQSSRPTQLVADETVHKERRDRMERAATTTSSLEADTMASVIICLADNQKFNFPKYIFDNMVKSLEGEVNFYLFLRFLQVFLDKQVEGMARHKEMYIISSYTNKIFANMRRIGEGFSSVITPLFDSMMVQATANIEVSHDESEDKDHVRTPSSDPLLSGEDSSILNELMVFYTSLQEQGRTNDNKMFGVDDLAGEEVVMEITTGVKDSAALKTVVTEDEVTMAQALAALKSIKPAAATIVTTVAPTPRAKGIVFHEQKKSQIPTVSSLKDKGKDKMIEPEVPIKKKDQMRIDKEYARKLEAKEQLLG